MLGMVLAKDYITQGLLKKYEIRLQSHFQTDADAEDEDTANTNATITADTDSEIVTPFRSRHSTLSHSTSHRV